MAIVTFNTFQPSSITGLSASRNGNDVTVTGTFAGQSINQTITLVPPCVIFFVPELLNFVQVFDMRDPVLAQFSDAQLVRVIQSIT